MRRRPRRKSKQIEISSLIDILFILLIFLMVSVRFTESRSLFEFNLPKSEIQQVGDSESEIIISISKAGDHFLNGKQIDRQALYTYIKTEIRPDLKPVIILEMDVETKFGDFFEIINLLKQRSILNVQIATKKDSR
jgi:biopolymer transport protein ExbD